MKYSEIYAYLPPGTVVCDHYVDDTQMPCAICGEPTRVIDVVLERYFCSDACEAEAYRQIIANMTKEVDAE